FERMSRQPAGEGRARADREIPIDGPVHGRSDAAGVVDIEVAEHRGLQTVQNRRDRSVEVDDARTGKSEPQLDQLRTSAGENGRSTVIENAGSREVPRECVGRVSG